jgi:hypothetical protein
MSNWESLDEEALNDLDKYIIESELAEEHRLAALHLRRRLAKITKNDSQQAIHNLAMSRKLWLENDPYARALADKNVDEAKWLELRRTGVTATEVAKLATKRPGEIRNITTEKLTGERSFFGNKYTAWGLERESAIAKDLFKDHGILASDVLFHAPGNERHLATPDGVKVDTNGSITISEIKTSKFDLDPAGDHFAKTSYYDQIQWQMYVMGQTCTKCLFAWETHDDNWQVGSDGIERPEPLDLNIAWIDRDEERIEVLLNVADTFLEEIEWAAA